LISKRRSAAMKCCSSTPSATRSARGGFGPAASEASSWPGAATSDAGLTLLQSESIERATRVS
jgi:hypothetical protein